MRNSEILQKENVTCEYPWISSGDTCVSCSMDKEDDIFIMEKISVIPMKQLKY